MTASGERSSSPRAFGRAGDALNLPDARRADWTGSSWLYRGIYKGARQPVLSSARVQLRGAGNVPATGGVVVAANHWSWWDPILVCGVMSRQVCWLGKQEVFKGAFNDWFFRTTGVIPVDRRAGNNRLALAHATDALAAGRVVGIFPEGTRSEPGKLLPAKRGVARLALRAGVPVLPIAVASDRFWGKGMPVPKFGEPVYVKIGPPVHYDYYPDDADDVAITKKVADDVMHRVSGMLDECLEARARGDAWA